MIPAMNELSIEIALVECAAARVKGRRIRSICIGYNVTIVELDDGSMGTSAMLKEPKAGTEHHLTEAGTLIGAKADKVMYWLLEHQASVKRNVALATINAASAMTSYPEEQGITASDLSLIHEGDVLGIVGFIAPMVRRMAPKAADFFIFDNSLNEEVSPPEKQPELIPKCSVVCITGTSFLNHTVSTVLSYCRNAREVVIVGPSTPLFPEVFADTPVTFLAGSRWPSDKREQLFSLSSQAAGVHQLSRLMRKVTIPISRGS